MQPIILWFRRNLRLADNAALLAAVETGQPIIPVYVSDASDEGTASRWWLHHSLQALDGELRQRGTALVLRAGSPPDVLQELEAESGATGLYFARRCEPDSRRHEDAIDVALADRIDVRVFDDSLLQPPETVMTNAGMPYKVFTPFWKASRSLGEPDLPEPAPAVIRGVDTPPASVALEDLGLLAKGADRFRGYASAWTPGESGGLARLDDFESLVASYGDARDRPDIDATSRLSPHLYFGEISVRQVWHAVRQFDASSAAGPGGEAFLRQLFWRDFSSYLLWHFPDLPDKPLRPEFENFPWRSDEHWLQAWQEGRTGYPIVDAGMRQLKETGWMHNRVRMIVASFLIKDLLIPWQTGAHWFLDTLVDADLANNSASWQWVAGCGTDAAPYFRVFNPTLQGEKFDPQGAYVRRWIPELGTADYPAPIVDHAAARRFALDAYASIKGMQTSKQAPLL